MPYAHLLVHRDGPVETVTLNRPQVRNAFNEGVIAELTDWAESAARAASFRVAVLAGAGSTFSAGADLAWMSRMVEASHDDNVLDAQRLAALFHALDTLPVPLIGRVQGAAFGGGCGLAAVCDIVAAASDAVFGFTEVKLGIIPAVIAPFALAKIGRSAARELFLTGARFPAARAREIGLVHTVVPEADLDTAVAGTVREVLAAGPEAVAAAKRLIRDVWPLDMPDARRVTTQAIARQRVSAEGQEGMRAFLEKRRAGWRAD
jgi:methylglutaconyl-CoA hydratase